ncbi:MAG: BlaI/MecI/CopY family transcriptional regulator [Planctomycetota bacterium]|nr:BlaI/MecI/CopY family transcriptional regulator [Planctomycetota bacterium]
MPTKNKVVRELAPREEQIMQTVFRLQKATVAEVREQLSDPPSYSAVRTMLGQLERKGYVTRDKSEIAHYYKPVQSRKTAGLSAFRRLVDTFFPHSPGDALAALIDESAKKLSDEDINQLEQAIRRARSGE